MVDASIYTNEERASSLGAREYLIVGGGLAGIALIGWAYMFYMAWAMANMDKVDMWMPPMASAPWLAWDYFMLFAMWAVMMASRPAAMARRNGHSSISSSRSKSVLRAGMA